MLGTGTTVGTFERKDEEEGEEWVDDEEEQEEQKEEQMDEEDEDESGVVTITYKRKKHFITQCEMTQNGRRKGLSKGRLEWRRCIRKACEFHLDDEKSVMNKANKNGVRAAYVSFINGPWGPIHKRWPTVFEKEWFTEEMKSYHDRKVQRFVNSCSGVNKKRLKERLLKARRSQLARSGILIGL